MTMCSSVAVRAEPVVNGPTPDGAGRYARLEALNAPVFVVPAAFVSAAQTPPLDLLDRSLLLLDPGRIAKVRVAPEKAEDAFTLLKNDQGAARLAPPLPPSGTVGDGRPGPSE